jgi:hypothetical protein
MVPPIRAMDSLPDACKFTGLIRPTELFATPYENWFLAV